MKDEAKTQAQLISELVELRQQIAELEKKEVDYKQMQEKLRESEKRFRAFMDNNPASIYIKDENDRHIYGNPAALASVGKKPDEFFGSTTRDLWPPEVAAKLIELDRKVLKENIARLTEEWSESASGDVVWRRDIKFPIKLESGKKLLGGIAIDTTEVKQSEQKLQESYDEIKRTEQALAEQLEFEKLIADIAATLTQTDSDKLGETIDAILQNLCQVLHTERSFLAQFSQDGQSLRHTNIWAVEGLSVPTSWFELEIADDFPWLVQQIQNDLAINTGPGLIELPDEARKLRNWLEEQGIQSGLVVPVRVEGTLIGMLGMECLRHPREYPSSIVDRLKIVADMVGSTIRRAESQAALQDTLSQIKQLTERLEQENIYLREEITLQHKHHDIVGQSDAMKSVLSQAEKVAKTDSTVLILGETGTGKELLAHAIHGLSSRKKRRMLTVHCSALPGTLIESELFGREKGAYTGALTKQVGRFEVADGSTIFLDEISELPLELQTKLLRVLEDGTFERLGSSKTIRVDVRVIAATNRDLAKEVSQGRFREDLYYRLNVFPVTIPPLRERRDDIPLLGWTFVKEYSEDMGKTIESIPRKTMDTLQRYSWPGNVRELKNVVERAMILSKGPSLHIEIPGISKSRKPRSMMTLEEVEKRHITNVLETSGWRVRGKNGAAEILGLKPTTLDSRIKKLGIPRRPSQSAE